MTDDAKTRPYHSPLRDQRAAETRSMVVEALADLISDQGTTEFSMQDVADRAGVSVRTVYRYFPNRQALLDGVSDVVDERLAAIYREGPELWEEIETLEELLGVIPLIFKGFDELVPLSTALTLLSGAGYARTSGHDERTEAFRQIIAPHLAGLSDEEARATFAVIRHLVSANTWFVMREEFGLGGCEAGEAIARSVAAIIDNAGREGRE